MISTTLSFSSEYGLSDWVEYKQVGPLGVEVTKYPSVLHVRAYFKGWFKRHDFELVIKLLEKA